MSRAGAMAGAVLVAALAVLSVFTGVADVTPASLLDAATRDHAIELVTVSRLPRTIALVLAGASLAVAGLIMQLLTRNPFVEPATSGTMEFAGAGLLAAALITPDAPVALRMALATIAALAGTALFLRILDKIPMRDILIVPLIGILLGGIVTAATTFVAYRADLMQSLGSWLTGDFSATIAGRYELLWIAGVATAIAMVFADRLTIAGMGEDLATNLGLDHRRMVFLGMTIVSVVSAIVVVTVGMLPFIGLVVPHLVALVMGSNARRTIPWVALVSAILVLTCDLLARTLRAPYELPIGTILGVLGGGAFLILLLRRSPRGA